MRLLRWLIILISITCVSYSQSDSLVVQLTDGTIVAYAITDVSTIRFEGTTTNVEDLHRLESIVRRFTLQQNYPNPFNPSTTIEFELPEAGHVEVALYDVNGRMIRHLESSDRQRGAHRVLWDGRDDSRRAVASGIYLCRVAFHKSVLTKKLVLIK